MEMHTDGNVAAFYHRLFISFECRWFSLDTIKISSFKLITLVMLKMEWKCLSHFWKKFNGKNSFKWKVHVAKTISAAWNWSHQVKFSSWTIKPKLKLKYQWDDQMIGSIFIKSVMSRNNCEKSLLPINREKKATTFLSCVWYWFRNWVPSTGIFEKTRWPIGRKKTRFDKGFNEPAKFEAKHSDSTAETEKNSCNWPRSKRSEFISIKC